MFGPFDRDRLEESLAGLLEAERLSHPAPSEEVHKGYRRVQLRAGNPHFGWLLDEFAPVDNAWLSWIEPHGFVRPHKDAGPHRERWQVPIRPSGVFNIGGEPVEQRIGRPFQVSHWLSHWIEVGDTPRVHVVLDRDVFVSDVRTPFELT